MTKGGFPQNTNARDEAGKEIEGDDQIVPDTKEAGNDEQGARAKSFLAALGYDFPFPGGFELRLLGDGKTPKIEWPNALNWSQIEERNKSRNVYFGVAARRDKKGDKAHCVSASALWADLDGKDFDPNDEKEGIRLANKALEERLPPQLQPSIVVFTGHGYHAYWLLREPFEFTGQDQIDKFESHLRGLTMQLGGDAACCDVARLMRLPGTLNIKDPEHPIRCRIEDFYIDRKFDLGDIAEIAPPMSKGEAATKTTTGGTGIPDVDAGKIMEGRRNATLASLGGTMRKRGMTPEAIEAALIAENVARCTPPLDEGEVKAIAGSVARYEPATAISTGWVPRYRIGQSVESLIRGNFGHIIRIQPSGGYIVHFRNPDTGDQADVPYAEKDLTPAHWDGRSKGGNVPLSETEKAALEPFDTYMVGDPETEPDEIPPPPLVRGLIPSGLTLFAGRPKGSKKTLFAACLVACLADGRPFFGRPTQKKRVLIVQRDMGRAHFLDYVRAVRAGMGIDRFTPLPVIGVPMDLMTERDQVRLFKTIERHKAEVLIIDSTRSTSSVEENFSEQVMKITRNLCCDILRDKYGLSIILITHTAKGGAGARGSGEWFAGCESQLCFEPAPHKRFIAISGEGRCPDVEFAFKAEIVFDKETERLLVAKLVEVGDDERQEAERDAAATKVRLLAHALYDKYRETGGAVSPNAFFTYARERLGLRGRKGTDKENALVVELLRKFTTIREGDKKGTARQFTISNLEIFRREYATNYPRFSDDLAVPPEAEEDVPPNDGGNERRGET